MFPPRRAVWPDCALRRGAIAIPSNIAEGYGRESTSDYLRFLKIARGAAFEIETRLLFAVELEYIDSVMHHELQEQINQCLRLLHGLIRSLEGYVLHH